jgi:outer membrane protein TolC
LKSLQSIRRLSVLLLLLTTTPLQLTAQVPSSATSRQNPFLGGVSAEQATDATLDLSLNDALQRGLKYNMGLLLSEQASRSARAQQLFALSTLMPNVNASVREQAQQLNLAVFGLSLPGIPAIVGPFSLFDTRGSVTQSVVNLSSIQNYRASKEASRAAQFSYADAQEMVVQVVTTLYLLTISGRARVNTAEAQLATAKAVYDQTVHLKQAGMAASIDVLRAQVQMQSLQQRFLASKNDLQKQKLSLARAIGLPEGQQFSLKDDIPYTAAPIPTLDEARRTALEKRADYQQVLSQLKASVLVRKAANAEYLPSIRVDSDYGVLGRTPGNSHGTFTTAATLLIPVFQGGRVKAAELHADAELRRMQVQADDLRGRISQELRNSLDDLETAAQQVEVARSSVTLASEQLTQARDRFRSGVANTIEVVQAQESVANTNESLIATVYAYNVAKTSLARAMGIAEAELVSWLKPSPGGGGK